MLIDSNSTLSWIVELFADIWESQALPCHTTASWIQSWLQEAVVTRKWEFICILTVSWVKYYPNPGCYKRNKILEHLLEIHYFDPRMVFTTLLFRWWFIWVRKGAKKFLCFSGSSFSPPFLILLFLCPPFQWKGKKREMHLSHGIWTYIWALRPWQQPWPLAREK